MKTILTIREDVYSDQAYREFIEDINYLVNELNVFCEIKNNSKINIVEDEKRYLSSKDDYSDSVVINAVGYSQSEWQKYTIYYNECELNTPKKRSYFDSLIDQLRKSFTHFNDYSCELSSQTTIDGVEFYSAPFDFTTLSIRSIEFPSESEIVEIYNNTYGENYDEIVVELY